jgi:hypothetical protein
MSATTTPTPSTGFKGIAPNMLTGDRSRLDAFLNEFRRYKMLNHNNEAISVPLYRVLTALSYIKGPIVEDWVNAQGEALERRVDTTQAPHVATTDEILWTAFKSDFKSAWKDTAHSASMYDQLMKLVMKELDIDTYTATFERLAAAADWEPNAKGTFARYRQGLRENVHRWILNRENLPANMAGWKEAAHKEVNRSRKIQNTGLAGFRGNQRPCDQTQFQSNQTRATAPPRLNGIVPMEVDAANGTLPFKKLTDEECAQYRAEGHCFRCRSQGHMARNCPKNANPNHQNSASVQTNDAASTPPSSTPSPTPSTATIATVSTVTATPAAPPGPKLTIAQQIRALKEKMTEEERGAYLDAWDMGQDFCDAGY